MQVNGVFFHGLVPVKLDSVRIPGKNFLEMEPEGYQLWAHAVQYLRDCGITSITVLVDRHNDFLRMVDRSGVTKEWLTLMLGNGIVFIQQEKAFRNPDDKVLIKRREEGNIPEIPLPWIYHEVANAMPFDYLAVACVDSMNRPPVSEVRQTIQTIAYSAEPVHEAVFFGERNCKTNAFNLVSRSAIYDRMIAGYLYAAGQCGSYDLNTPDDLARWNEENPDRQLIVPEELPTDAE